MKINNAKLINTEYTRITFSVQDYHVPVIQYEKEKIKRHKGWCLLEFRPPKRHRTLPQNALIHALWQQIANETGHELQEIKDIVKNKAVKYGYPLDPNLVGEMKPRPSSRVEPREIQYLIDATKELAAFLNIILRDEKGEVFV